MAKAKTLSRVFLVALLALGLSGCLDEEYAVVINEDGSGSVQVTRVVDDRITVLLEDVDQLADFPMFNFADLGKMILEGAQSLKDKGFNVTGNESKTQEDGTVRISYTAGFDSVEKLADPAVRQEIPVSLSQGDASALLITADLVSLQGPGESGASMGQPMGEEMPLGLLYAFMKGFHRKISVTVPAKAVSESGEVSSDGKTVTWEFDLRNRAALDKSRALFAKATLGQVTASAPLAKLAALLPQLSAEEQEAPAEQPEESGEKPENTQAGGATGTYTLKVASVVVSRTRPLDPPAGSEISSVTLNMNLEWPPETTFLRTEAFELTGLKDDTGNDVEAAATGWSPSGDDGSQAMEISIDLQGASAEAKKLVGLKGTLPVVSAKDVKRVKITLEQLQQADGQESTGVAALDALKAKVHDLSETGFSLQFGESDPENNTSVMSATMATKGGEQEKAWSCNCMWGDCSIDFSTALTEAKSIELEIPSGEIVEQLAFEMPEIELP